MKLFNLVPKKRRKKPKKQEDIHQESSKIPNLIKELVIARENQVWVADFTYLRFHARFVYLATVEDVFTRQIIEWEVSTRHDASLVNQAILNALRYYKAPDISHSDQGSEYKSKGHQDILEVEGIKQSMSSKGSPWQNGYQESFYSGFKLELEGIEECQNLGEAIEKIAIQIHYYNNLRIHSALGCPPVLFALKIKSRTTKVENIDLGQQIEHGICV